MANTERGQTFGRVVIVLWMLVALAAGVGGYAWFSDQRARDTSRSYSSAIGGRFALTDTAGKPVTNDTLFGKPYAIFFGFTRCPDVCPTTLSRLTALRKALGADGDKVRIVFVTVDPARDTRDVMAQYLTLFDTPITGLTGSPAAVAKAVKAFRVFYEKVPQGTDDYTIDHTATVFLMTARGELMGTIAHDEGEASALAKLKALITA